MDWLKQTSDKPLFPDLLWSRPETLQGAGKLLIIGGNEHSFVHVANTYNAAEKAGAGMIRVLVPDSLRKITKILPHIEYAPSNPSGSFAKSALTELLEAASWSDGVLLAGDLGKNSETSLLLEAFLMKFSGLVTIDSHALESIKLRVNQLIDNKNRVIIWDINHLRQAAIDLALTQPVISNIDKPVLASILHSISSEHTSSFVINLNSNETWIANKGRVAQCYIKTEVSSASFAVWALQNPTKNFEALVSATA